MAFDADSYLKTLEPPTLTLGGKTYVGRPVSIQTWDRDFRDDVARAQEGDATAEEIYDLIYRYTMEAFPRPWWKRLLLPFGKTVADRVVELPPAALLEVMRDFFESQVRAIQGPDGPNENGA